VATDPIDVYDEHIRMLPAEQRLELLALIAADLAAERQVPASETARRSLRELHGLGKEIWSDIDAQEYVDRLRDEWHDRAS
jgi:hypothetical protein